MSTQHTNSVQCTLNLSFQGIITLCAHIFLPQCSLSFTPTSAPLCISSTSIFHKQTEKSHCQILAGGSRGSIIQKPPTSVDTFVAFEIPQQSALAHWPQTLCCSTINAVISTTLCTDQYSSYGHS